MGIREGNIESKSLNIYEVYLLLKNTFMEDRNLFRRYLQKTLWTKSTEAGVFFV